MLISKRLKLRLIKTADSEQIHRLHSIPAVDEFNTLGIPKDLAQTESILASWRAAHDLQPIQNYTFAIIEQGKDEFIGLFGLKLGSAKYQNAEVWYKLHPDHWGKGYATEVLLRVLSYAFDELSLHRITAGCAVGNIGSIRVLEKVGMIREGRGRQILPLQSGWSDNFEYAILETDWRR